MPTLELLQCAPVKSLRANEDVDNLTIDANGLVVGDRKYMFVEGAEHINTNYQKKHVASPGHFLSQREDPVLTHIVPELTPGGVILRAPGVEDLVVVDVEDTAANRIPVSIRSWQGEGIHHPDAADWASHILKRPVRLVAVSQEKPRFVQRNAALGRVGFSDGFALTGASPEAFALLNRQLKANGSSEVPNNRMRTTFVIAGLEVPNAADLPEGFFPDDYVKTITFANNGLAVVFKRFKPCSRCPIPDTDQETGARKGRPVLAALTKLGRHGYYADQEQYGTGAEVFFSQNYVIELPKGMGPTDTITIPRGAEVSVEYDTKTNWISK